MQQQKISYSEIEALTLERVPEIKDEYYSYGINSPYPTDEWIQQLRRLPLDDERRIGSTILFESILTPYIVSVIENSKNDIRVFDLLNWLEFLANQEDPRIKDTLIGVCFCEKLFEMTNKKPELFQRLIPHLGKKTKELCFKHSKRINVSKGLNDVLKAFY
ncbi:MAG: hypothetical protein QNJ45_23940 [Ardenticatenaceae bacterium]|nr:hypothetical protein [Ardenticatenaceae bacterium]